ncbi:MAG TPA: hypothetical protein PK093_19015 [Phycisphaerae bacterium]|nr:hypothetical protein [Phycisphaerae bacterium]
MGSILAWREIQGANLVDWPRHLRTTDGNTNAISQRLDSDNDVRIFEAVHKALRDVTESADATPSTSLRDDIDAIARSTTAPTTSQSNSALVVSAAIPAITGIVGYVVIRFREPAGAMLLDLVARADVIYSLRRSWKSDRGTGATKANGSTD